MKYSKLNKKAKTNALHNYCNVMEISVLIYKTKVVSWFEKYDKDIFTKNGDLKHNLTAN